MAPMKKYTCKYPSCCSSYYWVKQQDTNQTSNKRFHRFPRDPDQCHRWRVACGLRNGFNTLNKFICEDHFDEADYINAAKRLLRPNAIPHAIEQNENLIPVDIHEGFHQDSLNDHNYCTVANEDPPSGMPQACNKTMNVDAHEIMDIEPPEAPPQTQQPDGIVTPKRGTRNGLLHRIGIPEKNLSPAKKTMLKIHRSTKVQICKLKKQLARKNDKIKELHELCKQNTFDAMENNLNSITKNFLNSQLRNCDRPITGVRWTDSDKCFALSVYKRSPRVYRYLSLFFRLPSVRTLKYILAGIPFEPGVNQQLLDLLQVKGEKMDLADRQCTLIFDEISLSSGFYYAANKQKIVGYEDYGQLGRTPKAANHAIVFMIRGLKQAWKQVLAYYFVSHTITTPNLKNIIKLLISDLQGIGFHVRATICDQGTTQRKALTELCAENRQDPTPYTFSVNGATIVTIYDVPHLLKCTRNSLVRCKIVFDGTKCAKLEYIKGAFDHDCRRTVPTLHKLKPRYFNFQDSFLKMKVSIAAAQLSNSVAAAIETAHLLGQLPAESVFTMEFVQNIDKLFDSLNGYTLAPKNGKLFNCVLTDGSPHLPFWEKMLQQIRDWRLIHLQTGKDVTNEYVFVKSWQLTIRAVRYLWQQLRSEGFSFLNLRLLNQDPVENLFCTIRQHGIANTNPTCHQFTASLKTAVINNLVSPQSVNSNCADDKCQLLENLHNFISLSDNSHRETSTSSTPSADIAGNDLTLIDAETYNIDYAQGASYVAGYLIKKFVPDLTCTACKDNLLSSDPLVHHLYTNAKQYSEKCSLITASDQATTLVDNVKVSLFAFLDKHGHCGRLEDSFCSLFAKQYINTTFCHQHKSELLLIKHATRLFIYKYVKDKFGQCTTTAGHAKKVLKFRQL